MKILMTADAVGGVWTYAVDLARGLDAQGCEVVLAVLGPAPAEALLRDCPVEVRCMEAPLDWTAETPEAVLAAGALTARLAEAERADVVHLNSPALAAGGQFRQPVLGVCHSDVATWWKAVRSDPIDPDLAWRATLTAEGYANCDLLAAPTGAFAVATAEAYGLSNMPEVIPNGRIRPAAQSPEAAEPPFVFACGRLWDEGKGMTVLDEAAASVSAPVFAAGPRQGPTGGSAVFRNLLPLGSQPAGEIARWHARAAIFCSPALYEPFGLAVLEAAQAGRALVLSDIATFRELWDGAAVFCPPGDARAFADALNALLIDPDRRESLGAAARDRAERFTPDAMVQGVLSAYRRLLPTMQEAAA